MYIKLIPQHPSIAIFCPILFHVPAPQRAGTQGNLPLEEHKKVDVCSLLKDEKEPSCAFRIRLDRSSAPHEAVGRRSCWRAMLEKFNEAVRFGMIPSSLGEMRTVYNNYLIKFYKQPNIARSRPWQLIWLKPVSGFGLSGLSKNPGGSIRGENGT